MMSFHHVLTNGVNLQQFGEKTKTIFTMADTASDEFTIGLILVQTCLLLFLEFSNDKILPKFYARKTCHALSGFNIMMLDPNNYLARNYVYLVVVVSIVLDLRTNVR